MTIPAMAARPGTGIADKSFRKGARFAVIEVGSRAVRMTIADVSNRTIRPVESNHREFDLLAFAAGSFRTLDWHALVRVLDCFKSRALALGAHSIRVFGTEAMRRIERLGLLPAGLAIEILTAEEEALLSFIGAAAGLGANQTQELLVVIDQGRGSLDIAQGKLKPTHMLTRTASLDLGTFGAAAAFEKLEHSVPSLQRHVATYLPGDLRDCCGDGADCVSILGSTSTKLAWLVARRSARERYDRARVHGVTFRLDCLRSLIPTLQSANEAQRRHFANELSPGTSSSRSWIEFIASLVVLCETARVLNATELRVSTTGTRLGALLNLAQLA